MTWEIAAVAALSALAALPALSTLTACTPFEARYRAPALPVEDAWPIGPVAAEPGTTATADIGWREFFVDPKLGRLIELALRNNRDLRVAVLDVEKARATYQVQRAARLPAVAAAGSLTDEKVAP